MPKPVSPNAERAFEVWCTAGEQNDVKTAELIGETRSNVQYWRRSQSWAERWDDIASPEAEIASSTARTMMRLASPHMVRRLMQIAFGERPVRNLEGEIVRDPESGKPLMEYAADNKDAIAAMKTMLGYNYGMPALQPVEFAPTTAIGAAFTVANGDTDVGSEKEETVEQLRAGVSALIESTVQSVNTRTLTRKGARKI